MSVITLSNISKHFGKVAALDNVSFSIESGKVIGLLGPNGSGKTTLLRIMAGLSAPTIGEIKLESEDISATLRGRIVYLPDVPMFPWSMNGNEAGKFMKSAYADYPLEKFRATAERLGVSMQRRKLSRGENMKLHIALNLARNAKLYLLDEPTANLDLNTRDSILSVIMECVSPNSSILISTHLVQEVEATLDSVIFLNEGRIIKTAEAEDLRENDGKSITQSYRELF